MLVQKRNGTTEEVSFDKILARIKLLCVGEEFDNKLNIDPTVIAQRVCSEIYDGVSTETLDELSYQISISMYSKHPDYAILASRICISNHHKKTKDSFHDAMEDLNKRGIVQDYLYKLVTENRELLESVVDSSRDYLIDFSLDLKHLKKATY